MKHPYHQIQLCPLEGLICLEGNKYDHYIEFSWFEKSALLDLIPYLVCTLEYTLLT